MAWSSSGSNLEVVIGVGLSSSRISWSPDCTYEDHQQLAPRLLKSVRRGDVYVVDDSGYNVVNMRQVLCAQCQVALSSIRVVRAIALHWRTVGHKRRLRRLPSAEKEKNTCGNVREKLYIAEGIGVFGQSKGAEGRYLPLQTGNDL